MSVRRRIQMTVVAVLLCSAALSPVVRAQDAFDVRAHYTKSEYMVPMRDGVKLFTIVYTPKENTEKYPFLLFRTPYSIPPYEPEVYKEVLGPSQEFDRDGY